MPAISPFPSGLRDEDKYGRKLRTVTRAGHSLGDTLIDEGLARHWCEPRMVRQRICERIVTQMCLDRLRAP
jgi:endonuclease YncB( thermonuclease family)